MTIKTIIKNNDKNIVIFDDVFELHSKIKIYNFVAKSHFYIGYQDTDLIERQNFAYMHSRYSKEDMTSLDFFNKIKDDNLALLLFSLNWKDTVVNMSFPTNTHFAHTHNDITCLYYVNIDWKEEWAGETIFYDESKEIIFCSSYKPGRIIVFDGTIPHTIRPQSITSPDYRFTMAIRFLKEDNWIDKLNLKY